MAKPLRRPWRRILRRAHLQLAEFWPCSSTGRVTGDLTVGWNLVPVVETNFLPTWSVAQASAGGSGTAAYRSHSWVPYASRTNTTVNVPAGTVDGDMLVAVILTTGAAWDPPAPTAPGGWTVMTGYPHSVGDSNFSVKTNMYWRRASSEPASYTWTHASMTSQGLIVAVSGASATTDPQATYDSDHWSTRSNINAPSITTANNNAWVAIAAVNWDLWGSGTPPTGTTPTFTERFDDATSLIYLAEGTLATAGATGNKSMDSMGNSSSYWSGGLVGVEAAAGGGGGGGGGELAVTDASQSGATLTVTGTAFGATASTVLLWDNFESGTNGAAIAASPQVGTWDPQNTSTTSYTTAQKHGGTQSLVCARNSSNQWGNFNVNVPDGTTFYQSFWFRYNYPAGGTGQSKLCQVHGSSGQGDFAPGVMTGGLAGDWWASYISTESGANDLATRSNYPAEPTQNTWHLFELVLKQSTANTADGQVTIRVDGAPVYNEIGVVTRETAARWNLVEFFSGMTNFSGTSTTWLDECYFASGWQRVEIGNAATYTACTKKSIQPVTSWSNTSISCTLNQGEFASSSTVYVYVTDANGNTNADGVALVLA